MSHLHTCCASFPRALVPPPQSQHICLRYRTLRTLCFPTLNEKRARMLVDDHVAGRPLRSVERGNQLEPILLPAAWSGPTFATPRCVCVEH